MVVVGFVSLVRVVVTVCDGGDADGKRDDDGDDGDVHFYGGIDVDDGGDGGDGVRHAHVDCGDDMW